MIVNINLPLLFEENTSVCIS